MGTGGGAVSRIGLGIGAPLLAAVLWGLFASPRAPVSAPLVGPGVQILVFGSAAAALYEMGHHVLPVVFVLVVVANKVSLRL